MKVVHNVRNGLVQLFGEGRSNQRFMILNESTDSTSELGPLLFGDRVLKA